MLGLAAHSYGPPILVRCAELASLGKSAHKINLDDYNFDAHSALIDRKIESTPTLVNRAASDALNSETIISLESHLDQDCYRFSECVDMTIPTVSTCQAGYSKVGHDRGGCGPRNGDFGQPICCKTASMPKSCTWRGGTGAGGGDCNGQCHAGEVTLFKSGCGGKPTESDDKQCSRGYKYFCCEKNDYVDLTSECYWTKW